MRKETEKEIEKHWKEYNDAIDYIALEVFQKQVKPYLQAHHMHFLAGNGTYYIYTNERDIDSEKLPRWLYNILEQEIPGMDANSLGTIMPDFHPE